MQTIKNKIGNEVVIYAETFEYEAYDQIKRLTNYSEYLNSKIRIMPDAHAGKACTVGTTMTIGESVTPALVGADIGCGMLVVELKDKEIDFAKLDGIIGIKVPTGFTVHEKPKAKFDFDRMHCSKDKNIDLVRALMSIGTLGGGNHFIEIDYSEKDDKYYLVIHTGSRKLGGDVCKHYQDMAYHGANEMKHVKANLEAKLKAEGKTKDIEAELKKVQKPSVDRDLVHLSGANYKKYLDDMTVVQEFAVLNRKVIADIIVKEMGFQEVSRFETIHNYIDFKRMILRKGAVSAEAGEKLLIPINMRDGALICVGKGNADWNYSAPHGAGRLMSRSAARETLSMDEYEESMSGIYSSSVVKSTLDESPQAYKPIEEIMRTIVDTVDILDVIKPVYNYKSKNNE